MNVTAKLNNMRMCTRMCSNDSRSDMKLICLRAGVVKRNTKMLIHVLYNS
jgi:hypothetical protein